MFIFIHINIYTLSIKSIIFNKMHIIIIEKKAKYESQANQQEEKKNK